VTPIVKPFWQSAYTRGLAITTLDTPTVPAMDTGLQPNIACDRVHVGSCLLKPTTLYDAAIAVAPVPGVVYCRGVPTDTPVVLSGSIILITPLGQSRLRSMPGRITPPAQVRPEGHGAWPVRVVAGPMAGVEKYPGLTETGDPLPEGQYLSGPPQA
jgi:hypothetical protein